MGINGKANGCTILEPRAPAPAPDGTPAGRRLDGVTPETARHLAESTQVIWELADALACALGELIVFAQREGVVAVEQEARAAAEALGEISLPQVVLQPPAGTGPEGQGG